MSSKTSKPNPLRTLFFLVIGPPAAFGAYFLVLANFSVPAVVARPYCGVCRALALYGLGAIFLGLTATAAIGLFVAVAAFTYWLDRYGLLEDIIVYALLVALLPLSLALAYFAFDLPAEWWRVWVSSLLCKDCA